MNGWTTRADKILKISRRNARTMTAATLLFGALAAGSAQAQDFDADATINIGSLYEPQNLDNTAGAGQGINEAFNGNVYEALFQLEDDGSVKPVLAKDYTRSEEHTSELQALMRIQYA